MFMINNNVAFKAMDGIWLRGYLYILSFIYGFLCLIMEGIGSDELQNGEYFSFYFYIFSSICCLSCKTNF